MLSDASKETLELVCGKLVDYGLYSDVDTVFRSMSHTQFLCHEIQTSTLCITVNSAIIV